MSFRAALAEGLRQGLEPEAAYSQAVEQVSKDELADYFRPVGVTEARSLRRMHSRQSENRVFGGGGRRLQVTKEPDRYIDVRAFLLSETFTVGDRLVTWGSATVEDHEQRAIEQEVRAGDLLIDADRHRTAAKLIKQKGAETLADLDDSDLAELVEEEEKPEAEVGT